MNEYIKLRDIPALFGLEKGDAVWIASDMKNLLYECISHDDDKDQEDHEDQGHASDAVQFCSQGAPHRYLPSIDTVF